MEKYAGRIGGGDFKWEFDNAKEDANYGIITALKSALTAYTSDLVKVGGIDVSGGNTGPGDGSGNGDGGNQGGEVTGPVEGEVTFIPNKSGNGFTVAGNTKSHAETVIAGITIPKNSALKLDSAGKVTFTVADNMKMYIYLLNNKTVSVDGVNKTPSAEGNCFVITVDLAAGSHTVSKGGGENALFLIKLVPAA